MLYRKGHQVTKRLAEANLPVKSVDAEVLEERFGEFGQKASEFVRELSAIHDFSYMGDRTRSLEDNVKATKKVFSKWSIEILVSVYLMKAVGFSDLKRLLSGISSRILSQKLKDLEELGLLERKVIEARPPSVRYTLSRRGETLAKMGEPVILYLRNEGFTANSRTEERE